MTNVLHSTPELRVICAGGFKAAMEKIAARFEATTGGRCLITVGTPKDTRRLMGGGAPFDVAVVTWHTLTDEVAASIDPHTQFSVAKSPVGMGVREDLAVHAAVAEIGSEKAFREAIAAVSTIAFSDSRAGTDMAKYILEAAAGIGIRSELEAKARYIMGPGFVVAQRVAAGEADAVMTLATEIISASGIRYLGTVPDSMNLGTVFEAAIANAAVDVSAAQSFIAFLRTREAGDIMRSTGLVTL